jgi:hypothetical protein
MSLSVAVSLRIIRTFRGKLACPQFDITKDRMVYPYIMILFVEVNAISS